MSSIQHTAAVNLPDPEEPDYETDEASSRHSDIRALLGVPAPVPDELRSPKSVAHDFIATLVAAGVDTYFGIPGGPVSPIFDAILGTSGAKLIESRHETNAVFAAADYHRASGKVPVVVVTAGPGITNAVTGIVSAHLEQVPMLVICGDVAWAATGRRLLQNSGPEGISAEHLVGHVTRAQVRVAQAGSLVSQGMAALSAATSPRRPGPALLVVPIDCGRAVASAPVLSVAEDVPFASPSAGVIAQTTEWLLEAERPLLVLGAGARRHAARVRRLVDYMDVPFVTTPQAKGVVSEAHPRSLRHGGLAASTWAREYTAGGVDCALVLGTDLDDCSVGSTPYVAPGGRLIHVDLDSTVFNRNLPTALGVVADVGAFADDLYEQWAREGLRHGRVGALVRRVRGRSAFDVETFREDDSAQITPHRAIADLEAAFGPEARFISDIGEHMLFALHYLTARNPDAFTIHLGLGSMGSGIGGAVGLSLADPERPVVCICGDGGMQMAGMEALVALEHELPLVYAVFNDARYNMVYHGYRQVFGREARWESPWIDFAGWARSLGMAGVRVNHPGEITRERMQRLVEARRPVVLDIRIDRDVRLASGGRNEALQHMSMPRALQASDGAA
jgi:acetolactate synthase I/II/III large subunit